jgi:hypothetical protein
MKKPAQGGLGEFNDNVLGDAYQAVRAAGYAVLGLPAGCTVPAVLPGRQVKASSIAQMVGTPPQYRGRLAMQGFAECAQALTAE